MPYYFGEGDPGWDELMGDDGDDDRPSKVSQFRYLPPPDLGGAPDPVYLSDQAPEPPSLRPEPAPAPPFSTACWGASSRLRRRCGIPPGRRSGGSKSAAVSIGSCW